jgi:integrase
VRSVMSGIFRHAIAKGRLSANPIRDAALLSTPRAPKQTGAYTPQEVLVVMRALGNHPQAALAVGIGFFLGLRTAEISGLQWSDISDDWKTIHVQRSVWRGQVSPGKTATSNAVLPLISPLREMLKAFKQTETVLEPSQFILMSSARTPLDLHAMSKRVIRPVLKNAGLPWRGFYAGRRGLATLLANTDPIAAQGMLRHSSLNTTQEFYIKAVPGVTLSAMKQLESSLRDNKGQSLALNSAND